VGIVEDVQWADPSTLEALGLFIEQARSARILLILSFRPEFHPPWPTAPYMTTVSLDRLEKSHIERMATQVAKGKGLPVEVVRQLVRKTDGVPLFVEELTKMVLESGLVREGKQRYELVRPLSSLTIPTTLHDSLMARLDRFATVREVAQLAALLGRQFSYELLQAVSPLDEGTLRRNIATLVEAELLSQQGTPPQATYLFKHALIQDAAYQSLLKSTRRQWHQLVAQILETRFPDTMEIEPELLAYHYSESGQQERAVTYWQRAGNRALERSANLEAIGHLTKALSELESLPDSPARAQQELVVLTALGPALLATKGYAAPEVEQTYARARDRCMRVGETPQLFPVLWGLWSFYHAKGDFPSARRLAEQLVRLAQASQEEDLLLESSCALAQSLFLIGEFAQAVNQLEQSLACYTPERHRPHILTYGEDPGVVCHGVLAWTLWIQGETDQALTHMRDAVQLAQRLEHPFTLAQVHCMSAVLSHFSGDFAAMQTHADAALALATEYEFPYWLATGTIFRGAAVIAQGGGADTIGDMERELATCRAIGAEMMFPYLLAICAEAYAHIGRREQGVALLKEAETIATFHDEHWWDAELCRLTGQLTLQKLSVLSSQLSVPSPQPPASRPNVAAEAERYFRQAIAIAQRQGASFLEQRAAANLAALMEQQEKTGVR
jgi:predicted ATPase